MERREGAVGRGEDREGPALFSVSTRPAAPTAVTRVVSTGLFDAAVATGSSVMPAKVPSVGRRPRRRRPGRRRHRSSASRIGRAGIVGRAPSVSIGARRRRLVVPVARSSSPHAAATTKRGEGAARPPRDVPVCHAVSLSCGGMVRAVPCGLHARVVRGDLRRVGHVDEERHPAAGAVGERLGSFVGLELAVAVGGPDGDASWRPGVASQRKRHWRQVSSLSSSASRPRLEVAVVDAHLDLLDAHGSGPRRHRRSTAWPAATVPRRAGRVDAGHRLDRRLWSA